MPTPQQLEQFKKDMVKKGYKQSDVNAYVNKKFKVTPISQPAKPVTNSRRDESGSIFGKVSNAAQNVQDFAVGAAKGALSTLKGSLGLVSKGLEAVAPAPVGERADESINKLIPSGLVTTNNTAEKIGFGTEQIAEFLIPASKVNAAQKAVNTGSKALNVLGRAGIEGASNAGVRLAQTGGDGKDALTAGLLTGGLKVATGTIGEVAKASGLPEYLYSKIFKTTSDDMFQELKTRGIANLQKTDPKLFQRFLDTGIIKAKDGAVVLDETLAKEALDRGLKGSINKMANAVVTNTLRYEDEVRTLAKNSNVGVRMSEKQWTNVLRSIAKEYEDVGFGEWSKKAASLADEIDNAGGTPSAEVALEVRRLLDRLRIASSFNANPPKLSLSQSNLKTLADELRQRLNTTVPGMGKVMNEYRFNIDALDTLAKEAARRGNREVMGFIDSVFLSSGIAAGAPGIGTALYIGRRFLNAPFSLTNVGSAIQNSGGLSKPGALLKGFGSRLGD